MSLDRSHVYGRCWDGHQMLLHESTAERASGLMSWVRQGLANNEKVIWSQDPAEPEEVSLTGILSRNGMDAAGLLAAGALARLPLGEYFRPGARAGMVERALAEGYRAVRITCAAAAALTVQTWPAYMRVEREIGVDCQAFPLRSLCQYQQTAMREDQLREVTGIHLRGIRHSLLTTAAGRAGVALAGEVDVSNETVLTYVVQAAVASAGSALYLELSQLRFLSLAGCQLLDSGTRPFRARGGRVVLSGVSGSVALVIGLTGLDKQPGVVVAD